MNTATATGRTGRPSQQGAAPTRRPVSRPPVRAVQAPVVRPARAPFVVLVLVLLSLGLGTLLLLNTLLAQGSFTLHELEAKVADLADQEQALQQKAAALAAPQRLARSATELGMVASVNPAFLRAEDGKVLGAPVPATGPPPVVGSEPEAEAKPNTDTSTSTSTSTDAGQVKGEQQASQDQQSQQTRQGEQTGNNEPGNEGADR